MKLPLPPTPDKAAKSAIEESLYKKLLLDWNVFAPIFYHDDGWWVRCCAQVYNEVRVPFMIRKQQEVNEIFAQISDFEYLGRAYKDLVTQVKENIINEKGELRENYVV